jgi:class 3 adenylate cyclase
MVRAHHRNLDTPDEVRAFPNGRVEIYEIGDVVVGRQVFAPGWRWSVDVQPIAGTRQCEYHHMGYAIEGSIRVALEDGTSYDIGPNEAYEIPPGHDAWVIGDVDWVSLDWAGMRSFGRPVESRGERTLATILFTDLVDSTAAAAKAGDGVWRDTLARHNQAVRFELDRFRGREIGTTGDGFLAIFDGAERAVRCAAAICLAVKAMGLSIRAGLHTGEIEFVTGDVRGIAVHAAARVMALARPDEVLVSGTTHALLEDSGLEFEDRGLHELKGITGARHIFALGRPPGPARPS